MEVIFDKRKDWKLKTTAPPLGLLLELQQQVGFRFAPHIQTMYQNEKASLLFTCEKPFAVLEEPEEIKKSSNGKTFWLVPRTRELIHPFLEEEMSKAAKILAKSSLLLKNGTRLAKDEHRGIKSRMGGGYSSSDHHFVLTESEKKSGASMRLTGETARKLRTKWRNQKRYCSLMEQSFGVVSRQAIMALLKLATYYRRLKKADDALSTCLYVYNLLLTQFEQGKFIQYNEYQIKQYTI